MGVFLEDPEELVAATRAALLALLIAPEQSAPLAYIGGTLGVLIGADLLRLRDARAGDPSRPTPAPQLETSES